MRRVDARSRARALSAATLAVPLLLGMLLFDSEHSQAAVRAQRAAAAAQAPTTLYLYSAQVGDASANVNAVMFDGRNIWVAVEEDGGGRVKKLSSTGAVMSSTNVGIAPLGMAYDGARVWVTDYTSSDVTVVSADGVVLKTFTLPANANPEGILFDGTYVWVANNGVGSTLSNTVSKYDAATLTLVANYPVGLAPADLAFDGTYVWLTNSYSDNVVKLDRRTGAILSTYPTGDFPTSMVFDGKNIWVANGADADEGPFITGSVTKLRAYGGINLGTFPLGNTVRGLAYDGSAIWACNSMNNTFTRLSATNGARLGTYPAGARPRSLAYDGKRMWIANSGDNTVSVVSDSPEPVVSSQFAPGGKTNYWPIQPLALPPTPSAVDAAFNDPPTVPTPAGAIAAIVGTLLSDN
jgi:hypothetical protein